ncbi:multidrug resistance related protein 1, partial [Reticulomyxa filosa]
FERKCCIRLQWNEQKYEEIIDCSALRSDLLLLPAGDDTEIGEKGINLSGGQKARVCIARALYRYDQTSLMLFDDPLSAVDNDVANVIFTKGILEIGNRHNITRLVVLNSHLEFLEHFDRILVMESRDGYCYIVDNATRNDMQRLKTQYKSLLDQLIQQDERRTSSNIKPMDVGMATWNTRSSVQKITTNENKDKGMDNDESKETSENTKSISEIELNAISRNNKKEKNDEQSGLLSPSALSSSHSTGSLRNDEWKSTTQIRQTKQHLLGEKYDQIKKITKEEDRKRGNLKRGLLIRYLDAASQGNGYWLLAMIFVVNAGSQLFVVFSDLWLSWWASTNDGLSAQSPTRYRPFFNGESWDQKWWMLGAFCCCFTAMGVSIIRAITVFFFCIRASNDIHKDILDK